MTDNRTTELECLIKSARNMAGNIFGCLGRCLYRSKDRAEMQRIGDMLMMLANELEQAVAVTLEIDAKPCFATDYTHRRCKYSVNRGWTEDTKFYVPILRNGTLTADQVRECAEIVYLEGYSDGSVGRGAHIDETDWQAIADELNARAERTCRNENGNDKYANFICSECGLHMHKPVFGRSYVDEDGKRWYGTSSEHGLHYCPNCGAKVIGGNE